MGTGVLELLPAVAVVAVSAVSSNRMLGRSMGFISGQCQNHKDQNARRGLKRRWYANSNFRDALNVVWARCIAATRCWVWAAAPQWLRLRLYVFAPQDAELSCPLSR